MLKIDEGNESKDETALFESKTAYFIMYYDNNLGQLLLFLPPY